MLDDEHGQAQVRVERDDYVIGGVSVELVAFLVPFSGRAGLACLFVWG